MLEVVVLKLKIQKLKTLEQEAVNLQTRKISEDKQVTKMTLIQVKLTFKETIGFWDLTLEEA